MLLINETFLLLANKSFKIDHQHLSCINNLKIWLIIHFMTTIVMEFLILHIIILIYSIIISFFYCYWRNIHHFLESNWLYIYHLDTYSLMRIVLKKEMQLILTYISIAFLYTRFPLSDRKNILTYFNFLRWLIEASLLPQILILALINYYFICPENFFHLYHSFYITIVMTRIPLFFFMRYAEIQPNFFLNEFQKIFFNVFCYLPSKYTIDSKSIQ